MKIFVADEEDHLIMLGKVRWSIPNPGQSYKHQVGVQFNPYGDKEGFNSPKDFDTIKKLENICTTLDGE